MRNFRGYTLLQGVRRHLSAPPTPKEKLVSFLAHFLETLKKKFCKNFMFFLFFQFQLYFTAKFERVKIFFSLFLKLCEVRKNALGVQLINPLGSGWD